MRRWIRTENAGEDGFCRPSPAFLRFFGQRIACTAQGDSIRDRLTKTRFIHHSTKSMNTKFDVIWIGAGQATLTVAPRLVDAGKTVAAIEGGKFGGDRRELQIISPGCVPSSDRVGTHALVF